MQPCDCIAFDRCLGRALLATDETTRASVLDELRRRLRSLRQIQVCHDEDDLKKVCGKLVDAACHLFHTRWTDEFIGFVYGQFWAVCQSPHYKAEARNFIETYLAEHHTNWQAKMFGAVWAVCISDYQPRPAKPYESKFQGRYPID